MSEMSISEFVLHLGEMAIAQHEANHHTLERAAKIIEKRAKEKIGEYQGQAGEFPAWAELADSTKEDRVRKGFTENDPGLRTGEMRDSIEHKVADGEAHIGSDNDKLVYFELGTEKQPPRSVLGGAAAEKAHEVMGVLGQGIVASLTGQGVFGGKLPISR